MTEKKIKAREHLEVQIQETEDCIDRLLAKQAGLDVDDDDPDMRTKVQVSTASTSVKQYDMNPPAVYAACF